MLDCLMGSEKIDALILINQQQIVYADNGMVKMFKKIDKAKLKQENEDLKKMQDFLPIYQGLVALPHFGAKAEAMGLMIADISTENTAALAGAISNPEGAMLSAAVHVAENKDTYEQYAA